MPGSGRALEGADIRIERVTSLPAEELAGLVPASEAEGFAFLRRLREEWSTARERFDCPGEAFFTARIQGRLVGVCGLSRDPYTGQADVGRVRRLYVLPGFRGQGVGKRLVEAVLEAARPHFTLLSLRTDNPVAARFYEGLGFDPYPGLECSTHLRNLVRR